MEGTKLGTFIRFILQWDNKGICVSRLAEYIYFFTFPQGGAILKWMGSMTLQQEVTHLAFGMTFTDHDEDTEESTFLVVFSSGVMDHQFNEIIVSSMAPSFTVG